MEREPALRLVIVEDDALLRENLGLLLGGEPGIVVAANCASAEEALLALPTARADVMLSDLGLPGLRGVDLIRRAKALYPALEIVVLTVSEDRDAVFAALKAGEPGTEAFRVGLRAALEATNGFVGTHGVYTMSPTDHNGMDARASVLVVVAEGQWRLLK